jgi:dTDP-glucose pyrophosphorylase
LKEQIVEYFKDGSSLDVSIQYLQVKNVATGLARGIAELRGQITGEFCMILADEVYSRSNHSDLLKFLDTDFSAVCGIKRVRNPLLIRKNYSVTIDNERITSLVEKPIHLPNNFLGCGTFLFKPGIFDAIDKTPVSPRSKRVEFIDAINVLARQQRSVHPFVLEGGYVNVNSIDDYNAANYLMRDTDFAQKTVSVVVPAYNEEGSIELVLENYREHVSEVIVANGNSKDNTAAVATRAGARVITGNFRGYGDALKAGMDAARGDIIILTEADGSFFARDLGKILEYLKDADMVIGTRTTKQMIEQAANMNPLLRMGNIVVAKLIELLWLRTKAPRLTDVGCTYRGIWKSAYMEIRDSLHGVGPEFSPEMIIEVMQHNMRLIEIPVTYSGRVAGESKFSGNMFGVAKTALKMLGIIFRKRFGSGER